jgi:hypothetical protein
MDFKIGLSIIAIINSRPISTKSPPMTRGKYSKAGWMMLMATSKNPIANSGKICYNEAR